VLSYLRNNNVINYSCRKHGYALKPYICYMTPAEVNIRFKQLQERLATEFDSDTPDIKVMLFLIGVQELGKGPAKFSKRQKEELMHIANCRLFSKLGFYELEGLDQDGWPHWKLINPIPAYTLLEQEMIIKSLIIDYFDEVLS
jgi:hypothetical protein